MPVIASIVQQHVDDAAHLRLMRTRLVRAPHVSLRQLARHDERMAAHLDGIAVAGAYGGELVQAQLASPGRGELFTAVVLAIESGRHDALEALYALCERAGDEGRAGLLSALGWVSAGHLQGIGRALLQSERPTWRAWGLAACAMHGVDPGPALARALEDDDLPLRCQALQVVVRQGRRDLLQACFAATQGGAPELTCRALHACVLLGADAATADRLAALAFDPAVARPTAEAALRTVLRAQPMAQARTLLAALARSADPPLQAVCAVGVAGDPHYVPWLLEQMRHLPTARSAAESFAAVTGIDPARFDLEERPEPGDEDLPDVEEDVDLLWPDVDKIERWWHESADRFAVGVRYFAGQPATVANCSAVLRDGTQRQRAAAAEHLSLLQPGVALFDVRAPAWRQQRRLGSGAAAA